MLLPSSEYFTSFNPTHAAWNSSPHPPALHLHNPNTIFVYAIKTPLALRYTHFIYRPKFI